MTAMLQRMRSFKFITIRKGTNDERRINSVACGGYNTRNRTCVVYALRVQDDAKQNNYRNKSAGRVERKAGAISVITHGAYTVTKNEQKKRIHKLIQQAIDMDLNNETPTRFSQLQLSALVDTALTLQERMWHVYRFKFLATFVLFGLTHELKVSDALQLARQIRNARDDDELFVEFFYMLQAMYIDSLESEDEDEEEC